MPIFYSTYLLSIDIGFMSLIDLIGLIFGIALILNGSGFLTNVYDMVYSPALNKFLTGFV